MSSYSYEKKTSISTKTLAYCAMLCALSVVLSRLAGLMPSEFSRYSIGMVPVLLAGMLFGTVPGALVGFVADLVGCLFSGYGYNPIFCISPILYGLCGGLLHHYLRQGITERKLLLGIVVAYLASMALGSVLYMSVAMAWVYAGEGAFQAFFLTQLTKRTIQYAVVLPLDSLITWLLIKAKIFERAGIWPPKKKEV